MSPDVPDARWPSLNITRMITSFFFHHYIQHTFTAAVLQVLITNLPVSIGSDLFNNCLPACHEHLWIGHIKEVILHINRWGWILPWLKYLALLRQSNLLSTQEQITNSELDTVAKSTCFFFSPNFTTPKCELFHPNTLWMGAIWECTMALFCKELVQGQDPETQREAEKLPS